MSKLKIETKISPKGIFVYPCLNRPDTKFDEAGVYSVKLKLGVDEAQPLMEMINNAINQSVEETKGKEKGKKIKRADPPYAEDEESNTVTFHFKMKASGTRADGTVFTQKPGLKCTKRINGKPEVVDIPGDKIIGGGSIGKIAYSVAPFYTKLVGAGITLRLKAVQMFKIVEPSYSYGFEAEECDDDINEACEFAKSDDNESDKGESDEGGEEGSDADDNEGGGDAADF